MVVDVVVVVVQTFALQHTCPDVLKCAPNFEQCCSQHHLEKTHGHLEACDPYLTLTQEVRAPQPVMQEHDVQSTPNTPSATGTVRKRCAKGTRLKTGRRTCEADPRQFRDTEKTKDIWTAGVKQQRRMELKIKHLRSLQIGELA